MIDLSKHLPQASRSTIAKNPELFAAHASQTALIAALIDVPKKRLRQPADRRSKLEIRFGDFLPVMHPTCGVHTQFPLAIASGSNYYLDYLAVVPSPKTGVSFRGYEVKGPFPRPVGIVKLKTAARIYHWITFFLVSEVNGKWVFEKVLP